MDLIYRFDPYAPLVPRSTPTCESAVTCLCEGNDRFVKMIENMQRGVAGDIVDESIVIPISPLSLGLPIWPGTFPSQKPFVLILGCSDARVPVEPIFDLNFNDAFVVRVAGNILGAEGLGSFNYAIRTFDSLRVAVVLGHSGCGAVTAAVDTYLNPNDFGEILVDYTLRVIVDRIHLAVRHAAKSLNTVCCWTDREHPKYREALIETAVYLNAAITAFELRREIADERPLQVLYGVYDLTNMSVHSTTFHSSKEDPQLAEPPANSEEFEQLATRLAVGIRDRGMLV